MRHLRSWESSELFASLHTGGAPAGARGIGPSLILHGIAILALAFWQVPRAIESLRQPLHGVVLIAPAPQPLPRSRPVLRIPRNADVSLPLPASSHPLAGPSPRAFQVPALPRHDAPVATLLLPAPASPVSAPPVQTVSIELPHLAAPPPLKTDTFGTTSATVETVRTGAVATAGFSDAGGGAHGSIPKGATIQAGGFGGAQASTATPSSPRTLSKSGFADAAVAPAVAPAVTAGRPPGLSSSVEIVSKPKPAYTQEARNLQIEGEVLLEVVFPASGAVRVSRLIRGLGHGLDESAIAAARLIHFKPATRDGTPVDATAVIHIVFELAY